MGGERRKYDLTIPGTIRNGDKMRLSGQGASAGGARGDLYLTIDVDPHPDFRVDGDDLVVEVPVKVWDAALGAQVPVKTLDGEVRLRVPAGVSSGQRMRLKGKGLQKNSGERADLYAELKLVLPQQLSDAQRALFKELRESDSEQS